MDRPPGFGRQPHSPANRMDEAYVKISRSGLLCLGLLLSSAVYAQEEPQKGPPPRSGTGGLQTPPPAIPKVPDVRQPGEYGWWVELNGWLPVQKAYLNKGKAAAFTTESRSDLDGNPKYAEGAEVGMAVGLHNALRFSYFQTKVAGDFRSTNNLHLWNQDYAAGSLVSTNYKLQNGKISFEYLTWPFPVESRRFRLKTLWQVHYTGVRTEFGLPEAPIVDSNGIPLIDSTTGNPVDYSATGSKWMFSPAFGLGVSYFSGRHFRIEANGSGFAFPHHFALWDADASANLRYGHLEFRVGGKGYHWKTSTQSEFYTRGTIGGVFVGLRWYSTN